MTPNLFHPLQKLAERVRRFAEDTRGTLTVETALMMPMLAFFYVATFVWFDAFRAQNTITKATYTIADMVSRETLPISNEYLSAMSDVFDWLTYSQAPTQLRFTTAKCTEDCEDDAARKLEMCWSWATSDIQEHTNTSFEGIEGYIPIMVLGDTVLIVESFMRYQPVFNVRIDDQVLSSSIIVRPRYAGKIDLGGESCY
ncbi:MAG: hypothetical protein AAFR47_11515 [Pseudomonadota bacterium]